MGYRFNKYCHDYIIPFSKVVLVQLDYARRTFSSEQRSASFKLIMSQFTLSSSCIAILYHKLAVSGVKHADYLPLQLQTESELLVKLLVCICVLSIHFALANTDAT